MHRVAAVLSTLFLLVACGPGASPDPVFEQADASPMDAAPPPIPVVDGAPPTEYVDVFAHTADTLYRVDPETLDIEQVGPFGWPTDVGTDSMTDIALDKDGRMVGVSYGAIYEIDPETAACTRLATLNAARFVALSFVPVNPDDPNSAEKLVASSRENGATEGQLVEVDPKHGTITHIGAFGGGLQTSGDIVSVRGLGTFVTVRGNGSDRLARLDVTTGHATPVGAAMGYDKVFGLGFWGNRVYGFTDDNEFVLIDPVTGATTMQSAGDVGWWGAGVSTSAPVID